MTKHLLALALLAAPTVCGAIDLSSFFLRGRSDKTAVMATAEGSSQCQELGETAAEQVVMNGWCTPGSSAYGASDQPNFKAECKAAAVNICEGYILTVADRWCPNQNMRTSDLRDLQGDCQDQVDRMVPDDSGHGECGRRGVDDDRPRPVHKDLGRFRFNLVESNAKCADRNADLYEWGQFNKVKDFSDCAEACVNEVRSQLLESFRGYDWDCYDETCHCLYDRGTLDNRNSAEFTRTNRNESGNGSIERTVRSSDYFCAKLVGADMFGDDLAEIA